MFIIIITEVVEIWIQETDQVTYLSKTNCNEKMVPLLSSGMNDLEKSELEENHITSI